MMNNRHWILVLITTVLIACGGDENSSTNNGEPCDGGDELTVGGTAVCVYDTRAGEIIETGFSCPPSRATRSNFGDLIVCSDGNVPGGIAGELEEKYPGADLGDDPCAGVSCDADQTCVNGVCEDVETCVPEPEVCDDGQDNDCDGAIDCDDDDCASDPACALPGCQDPYEPNDTIATASELDENGPTQSSFCVDDVDFWATSGLDAGDELTVQVTSTQQIDITVRLVDASGEAVREEDRNAIEFDSTTGSAGGSAIVRRGLQGPFYLEIRGSAESDYQIEFSSQTVPRLANVEEIGAGSGFTCARDAGGSVYCWGDNSKNQLGTSTGNSNTPIAIDSALTASMLAVGPEHSCALMSDNEVWCWGANQRGELGVDTDGSPSTPVATGVTGPLDQIEVGRDFTCTLYNGVVQCWGDNANGQLGTPRSTVFASEVPVTVSEITDAKQLAVGDTHACVRRASDEVWCWGNNRADQLADSLGPFDEFYTSEPVAINPPVLSQQLTGVGLSAAGDWTVAQSDGYGQAFGSVPGAGGGVTRLPVWTFNNMVPEASTTIAGSHAWCRVELDGRVACQGTAVWEQNPLKYGGNEVAVGQGEGGMGYAVYVKDLVDPRAVSIGADHMCAIEAGGDAVCWGYNAYGQLGIGSENWSDWAAYVRAPM